MRELEDEEVRRKGEREDREEKENERLPWAEVLGVGSGSRLTRGASDSGVSVPFSVGSSFLVEDKEEAARLVPVDAEFPTLLLLTLLLLAEAAATFPLLPVLPVLSL